MLTNVTEIKKDDLLQHVAEMLRDGFRFVTITIIDLGHAFDLIYSFDKDYKLVNLRIQIGKDEELSSISSIYLAAVIVENEMKDLFGLCLKGLVLDYEGKLMLAENGPKTPQRKPITVVGGDAALKIEPK